PVADNETVDANETANTAPVLVVEIFDNGTLLVAVDGIVNASVGVNLTFEAANSTDADGDNLTFAWDFGDGNTSEGSNTNYTYASAGNYTLNVTVTDEEGASANTSIPLVVASSGPASGAFIRMDVQTFSDSVTDPTYTCGDVVPTAIASFTWTIPAAEPDGTATAASRLKVVLDGGSTAVDVDLFLYDPSGKELGSGTSGAPDETIEVSKGPYAAGDYVIEVKACLAVNTSVTVTAEADLVAV
ncbi:MAG TPA: PKD domain-containing protein, partial [Candidatus Thermoplasmatota archaeon]